MEAILLNTTPKRYGITEKKKSDLDLLTSQVTDAQAVVQQQQAVVTSLNQKAIKYQGYLLDAENNRTQSLSNKQLADQVIQNALDLSQNSQIAFSKMTAANENTAEISKEVTELINKLIYSVEIINKLSNLVIRKKALNPLISDDLITKINAAGTDANNAVALTLIALKSVFAAQSLCLESEAITALEQKQALSLYLVLTGKKYSKEVFSLKNNTSIQALLDIANKEAKAAYLEANKANDETSRQLNVANANLNKAQIELSSLQAALAAANAAALAS
ncbi:hypothetical protein GKZ90_0005450 [Flavobacterium sp. MC2016-06]|jgi:hypothetical protein|uniref:hypothetical protein n=1 Tax=Flavobacterium sp. MC2016-06 TaxID=2676308 RepID=UPI0012BACF40|nr:hypothetical protein [Flavobacterium sp. MC2016-06]MBU3857582.1 hypothetical protein [Flavobacterium sp. MC2016-06]